MEYERKAMDGKERREGRGAGRKTGRHIPLGGDSEYDNVAPHHGWVAEASDYVFGLLLYFPPKRVSFLLLNPSSRRHPSHQSFFVEIANASWIDTLLI